MKFGLRPATGPLPRSVATICELTWECAPAPRGPNEHANELGYAVMAGVLGLDFYTH